LAQYIHNELPTYLIRLRDMKLLSREDILEELRILISDSLKYAILSHRWGTGEPAFYQMSTIRYGKKKKPTGLGYEKLLHFCEKAKEYGCAFAWSDTCCINKESSSELEEAIRSMYRWYRDAHVCIIYLAGSSTIADIPSEPWFTRGWTLQELLAPRRWRFFGKDWSPVCPEEQENSEAVPGAIDWTTEKFPYPNDKNSSSVIRAVAQVTGIDERHLTRFNPRDTVITVFEKMSWASKRQTTRVEDIAYSLFGIFDISMPIAYGEGKRAFYRLCEAIVQSCLDPTLLAWVGDSSPYSEALPSSPECYKPFICGDFGYASSKFGDPSFSITKFGLHVKLLVVPVEL
ncbi:heterokaryon incompatibility protein-domain-containing protein, partial [Melanogaster broomeanus]